RLLTGRDHFTGPNRRAFDAGANLRRADALHAVRAFLHHAALPHGDLGISLHARGRLVARVLEVVEAAELVGTVVRAEPRPDAAVVDHLVQAVGAVNGGVHRTHVLAGRHLAVLAEHRLMHDARALVLAEEVGVDAQPVHFPSAQHALFADDGHVVLGLTRDDTRAAAGANGGIDGHRPLRSAKHARREEARRLAVELPGDRLGVLAVLAEGAHQCERATGEVALLLGHGDALALRRHLDGGVPHRGRIARSKPIRVRAEALGDRPGLGPPVAELERDRVIRVAREDQRRNVERPLPGANVEHLAGLDAERARGRRAQDRGVAPALLGERV